MSASPSAFPALNENCAASEVSSVPPVSLEHVILPQAIQDDVHAVAKDQEEKAQQDTLRKRKREADETEALLKALLADGWEFHDKKK